MLVRAIERGYHGQIREKGDEFEVPDTLKGRWFVPVEAEKPAAETEDAPARRGRPPKA